MLIFTKETWFKSYINKEISIIEKVLSNKADAYSIYSIPKKNGLRQISAINRRSDLYQIQKNLYNNFLNKFSIPVCVKGFVKGESFRSFLEPHQGRRYFLRIDLKDFFGSINEEHIRKILINKIFMSDEKQKDEVINVIAEICTLDGVLPQGAVTSPVISNLVLSNTDQRILKYCQTLEVEYTRYADDMLFSSNVIDFNNKDKRWFLKRIREILISNKFTLNYSKKQTATDEISFNGFVIAEKIRLARKRFLDISVIISCGENNLNVLQNYGEEDFLYIINSLDLRYRNLELYPFNSISQLIQYLSGYRSYFISWIDEYSYCSSGQKKLRKFINRIEVLINSFA